MYQAWIYLVYRDTHMVSIREKCHMWRMSWFMSPIPHSLWSIDDTLSPSPFSTKREFSAHNRVPLWTKGILQFLAHVKHSINSHYYFSCLLFSSQKSFPNKNRSLAYAGSKAPPSEPAVWELWDKRPCCSIHPWLTKLRQCNAAVWLGFRRIIWLNCDLSRKSSESLIKGTFP